MSLRAFNIRMFAAAFTTVPILVISISHIFFDSSDTRGRLREDHAKHLRINFFCFDFILTIVIILK